MYTIIYCCTTTEGDNKIKQAGAELCQAQLRFEVWGLVKALSLIFENDNVEEVWSQSSLKLKKLLDEKVWSFSWWSLKLKKV